MSHVEPAMTGTKAKPSLRVEIKNVSIDFGSKGVREKS